MNLVCPARHPPARQVAGSSTQTPDRANWYAPPFKVFDNFYWLGTRQHSSWALQTSAGIIIIDTNFAWATEPEIIEGLTKLGLNPRDIKYVGHPATPMATTTRAPRSCRSATARRS